MTPPLGDELFAKIDASHEQTIALLQRVLEAQERNRARVAGASAEAIEAVDHAVSNAHRYVEDAIQRRRAFRAAHGRPDDLA